jgi:hypothetical protein
LAFQAGAELRIDALDFIIIDACSGGKLPVQPVSGVHAEAISHDKAVSACDFTEFRINVRRLLFSTMRVLQHAAAANNASVKPASELLSAST